ncbi:MAG: hypothetical protein QXR98_06525 [Fervidicoccaceae archaeon]
MKIKEAIGAIITTISLLIFFYEIAYVGLLTGKIGASGKITYDAILSTASFLLVILGPALWFGEAPTALKKLVEAKRGKVEKKQG